MDEGLVKIRNARSRKDFPFLKLEDDEYVEFAFKRAKSHLMLVLGGLAFGLVIVLLAFLLVIMGQDVLDDMGRHFLYIILATLVAAVFFAGVFAIKIYNGNRLFITNKHAIQLVKTSPMSGSVNMIDLSSIEDASFSRNGLIQTMFHYGTFRLSTVGDETTYTFPYADISPSELKEVSDLITEAKKKYRTNKNGET
ncbi:hypothetical protein IKE19_01420 [Candidatus Saccharibacteria bacterium]|nr:hypothetical protein [Candidatus Saccharibacteria bacterium]